MSVVQRRCPISYELIDVTQKYATKGLALLSPRLTHLQDLPFTASELRQEAIQRASKMSIQGMQAKVSARLNVVHNTFDIVDRDGHYILKPPSDTYPELPQNEDLTMRLAHTVGIEVPLHGMVYAQDGSLTYFIQRFDRQSKNSKLNTEDFAQLSQHTRDTKYQSSMEKVMGIIEAYCTFPQIEKRKLFVMTLFNFLVGNEDMHLKNFSLITHNGITTLSPAYDLLNTTIALGQAAKNTEELALPLHGKKRKLNHNDLINYFGQEKLALPGLIIEKTLDLFRQRLVLWQKLIASSFLSANMQADYLSLLQQRAAVLSLYSIP